jgi:hypothetical protein
MPWLCLASPLFGGLAVVTAFCGRGCLSDMSTMSSEEIRAAAETYSEIGPGYRDAVIESFLEKVGGEIDARVAARLAALPPEPTRRRRGSASGSPLALAVISMVLGIPISAIAVAAGSHPAGALGLIVVWMAIAVINLGYAMSLHSPGRQTPDRTRSNGWQAGTY